MQIADGSDAVAQNSDIADKPVSAGTINDAGSGDYKIVVGGLGATRHTGEQQPKEGDGER